MEEYSERCIKVNLLYNSLITLTSDLPLDPNYLQNLRYEAGLDKDQVLIAAMNSNINWTLSHQFPYLYLPPQKPNNINITTSDKSIDTSDLVAVEVPIDLIQENIKSEPQNPAKRIKREPKTRKRTRKTTRQLKIEKEDEEEGKLM